MKSSRIVDVVVGIRLLNMQPTTTMTDRIKTKSRRKTPWTGVVEATPVQLFIEECTRRDYESKHPSISGSPEIDLVNSFAVSTCRHCGATEIKKKGFSSNGIQRYVCSRCGKSFTPLTGTVFDSHKIPITEWMDFLLDIIGYGSINLTSKANRNSYNTTKYWMDKVFLVLEGIQDDIVLSDRIWLDEKFYRVRAPEIQTKPDGMHYRGLSMNQMCIGVACDSERVVCILEGTGKTSKKKTWETFSTHIQNKAHLIHDMEPSHEILVKELNLSDTAYNSKTLKNVPDENNPLNPVNRVCFLLELFLNTHSGFLRSDMQNYLNLFCFIVNPPEGKYEKLEMFLNRVMNNPKLLRYRQ